MRQRIEATIVRIHASSGAIVGAGFLVGERHLLTCAHVAAPALEEYRRALDITAAPGVVQEAIRDLELIQAAGIRETRSLGFDTLSATLRATQPAVASQGLP